MLSAAVKEELKSQLPGVLIMDRFGASESGAQGAVDDGATGPRFVMNDETSVLDDELRPLRPGDGRIGRLARTGRIPLGYHKDQEKTAATFPTDPNGVRWSVPGDLASVEPDGTITVHGRGSASINSGGEKIFPEEVEAAVKAHPGVFDAIVVGIPDERFGERVAVVVQPRRESRARRLSGTSRHHCRERIAGYKMPRELVVVDAVPLTAAGKPDVAAARSLFTESRPPSRGGSAQPGRGRRGRPGASAPSAPPCRPRGRRPPRAPPPSTSTDSTCPASGQSPTLLAPVSRRGAQRAATRAG